MTALTTSLNRRKSYRACIYRGDFFVLKHLKRFIHSSLIEHVRSTHTILDLGCGEQPFKAAIDKIGARYIGIDTARNNIGMVDIIGDISGIPLDNDMVDIVLLTEVLEHVNDLDSAFLELYRVLKPGGKAILTIPFMYPLHEEPYDFTRPTLHKLKSLSSKTGFDLLLLEKTGNELEVMATVWDNMFSRMSQKSNVFLTLLRALFRLPFNAIILALSYSLGFLMPRKYYLNTVCILKKKTRR